MFSSAFEKRSSLHNTMWVLYEVVNLEVLGLAPGICYDRAAVNWHIFEVNLEEKGCAVLPLPNHHSEQFVGFYVHT
jgi:hypothetical protein